MFGTGVDFFFTHHNPPCKPIATRENNSTPVLLAVIGSPTQVARTFNQHFSGQPVSAQTVRKWLLAEAMPTQPKLLALAAWLGVSAQWLRYGSGAKMEVVAPLSVQQTGLVVLGEEHTGLAQYAGIIPLLDKLVRLPPRDIRIVEGMVQLMSSENNVK